MAAQLARLGYKTDPDALDGPWGYFQVAGGGVEAEAVESVRLGTTSNVLAALRYPEPANELEAKFSLPFCLAILVLEKNGGIEQFTDEVVLRPDVRKMMSRVTPYLHEGLEALGFQRIRSVVEVTPRDGTVLIKEASTSRGTPERPMTREELAEKFHDCARRLLSEATEQRVLETIYGLDGVDRVTELTALLKG